MKAACLLVVLAAVCVLGNTDAAANLNLDDIENIDASVFKMEDTSVPAAIDQASSPLSVSARDADLDTDTEAVAALADDAGVAPSAHVTSIGDTAGGGASDASALFSFRAMRQASALAGDSLTETSAQTHAAAMRVLKSHEVSADEMFAEINREQQILVAKRALVARQRQSIADSIESLARLKQLIDENKHILGKNEKALHRASSDLLHLINKYQGKLKAGITKDLSASVAEEPVALRSRPHQTAAYVKVDQKGVPRVDTTKSKAAHKAVKAAAAPAPGTVPTAAPKKAEAAPAPAPKKEEKKAAASAKAKFVQVHDQSEAEAEAEAESEEESSEEQEESDESEEEGSEEASQGEEESEEAEESEDSESEDSEESEESLIETKGAADEDESYDPMSVSHEALLPGLAPPPKVYDPEADRFI